MKKNTNKSNFRKVTEWLHLWLGLISGIIVFIVCLSACFWVFRDEINYFTHLDEKIIVEKKDFLAPSVIQSNASNYITNTLKINNYNISSITYRKPSQTSIVSFKNFLDSSYNELHVNPYSGNILFVKNDEDDKTAKFLNFVRAGHRFLWLPREIGSPIVGSGCLLFLVTIITGLIWWYPKKWNKSTREKSFQIKWTAKWKRVNIDLHNVLGFYAFIFSFILITTGISYSFKWFRNIAQYTLTGSNQEIDYKKVMSLNLKSTPNVDDFWNYTKGLTARENEYATIVYPTEKRKTYEAYFLEKYGMPYSQLHYSWQDTSQIIEIKKQHHAQLPLRNKLYNINFELHVGNIYGLPTKILAFLTSLVGASLPITGFIIWLNRKKKLRKSVSLKSV